MDVFCILYTIIPQQNSHCRILTAVESTSVRGGKTPEFSPLTIRGSVTMFGIDLNPRIQLGTFSSRAFPDREESPYTLGGE